MSEEDLLKREIDNIVTQATSGGDRKIRNATLRQLLVAASDEAIAFASVALEERGLVGRELIRRIREGHSIPLPPLIQLAELYADLGDVKGLDRVTGYVVNAAQYLPTKEVAVEIAPYTSGILVRKSLLFQEIITHRTDAESLVEQIISIVGSKNPEDKEYVINCLKGFQKQVQLSFRR